MPDKKPVKIMNKINKERQQSYDSLPPGIKDSFSEEEKNHFLYSEEWPEELFEKLEEFIIKKGN